MCEDYRGKATAWKCEHLAEFDPRQGAKDEITDSLTGTDLTLTGYRQIPLSNVVLLYINA